MTLLVDTRQCICELTEMVRKSNEDAALREEACAKRHNETLAYISEVSSVLQRQQHASHPPSFTRSPTLLTPKQKQREYFYGGDKLSTKNAVAGCVLMQIYNVAMRQMPSSVSYQIDATPMELRQWSTLVSIVAEAESTVTATRGKLILPKQNSPESVTASELVASPVEGRVNSCRIEHLCRLQDECPSVVAAVNEVRERVVACPGLISISGFKCLASISYPFVTRDNTLNIDNAERNKGSTKAVMDVVSGLNVPQRKKYAMMVLRDSVKPLVAAREVEKSRSGASTT